VTPYVVITSAAADGGLEPIAFVAISENAYPTQPEGHVTMTGKDVLSAVIPAGIEVTEYSVMGCPPLAVD
jgi:hypothetical protein